MNNKQSIFNSLKAKFSIILFLLQLNIFSSISAQNDSLILDASEFSKKLFESNNRIEIQKLVNRSTQPVVYKVFNAYSRKCIELVSKEDQEVGKLYLTMAAEIALAYSIVHKNNGLLRLVSKYESYDPEMASKLLEADSLKNKGYSYLMKNEYKKALNEFSRSRELYGKLGDDLGSSEVLSALGIVNYWLGQYEKASEFSQKSLELSRELGNLDTQAENLNNLGTINIHLAKYSIALTYLQQGLELYRKIRNASGENKVLTNISSVYFYLSRLSDALSYYQKALKKVIENEDQQQQATILANIAVIRLSRQEWLEASNAFTKALEISRAIKDSALETRLLINIGTLYFVKGDLNLALEHNLKILERLEKTGNESELVNILLNIGGMYLQDGHFQKGHDTLQQALHKAEQSGNYEAMWRIQRGMGEANWKMGEHETAVINYEKSIKIIEGIYGDTEGFEEEIRSLLFEKKRFVYKEFIDLLLELYRIEPNKDYDLKLFSISEKAKSRTFQESLNKADVRGIYDNDLIFQHLVENERQLKARNNNLNKRLAIEYSKSQFDRSEQVIQDLKEEITETNRALRKNEKNIESEYPRYADLKKPDPLSIKELQSILHQDETVLTYTVGKNRIAAFIIRKKHFKLVELGLEKKELTALIRKFRQGLDGVTELTDLEQFDPLVSFKLYQKLFQPINNELHGNTSFYLIGDDLIYTIPFEALIDKKVDQITFKNTKYRGKNGLDLYLGEYGTLHYMNETYTITYLPSASTLHSRRKYNNTGLAQWEKPFIAFADPIFRSELDKEKSINEKDTFQGNINETFSPIELVIRSRGKSTLTRLKESASEATAIAKVLNGNKKDLYFREYATEENVYKSDLLRSRYLLFATHGLLGGDIIGITEPALALTQVGISKKTDGFLTMSEVLTLDINSELVILSACNTYGQGDKAGNGEGFAGLTRSFMIAGAESLLITHWSVENQTARDLMIDTFKNIKMGSNSDEALHEAKIKIMNSDFVPNKELPNWKVSRSHPYFWAPFVLVGEL